MTSDIIKNALNFWGYILTKIYVLTDVISDKKKTTKRSYLTVLPLPNGTDIRKRSAPFFARPSPLPTAAFLLHHSLNTRGTNMIIR